MQQSQKISLCFLQCLSIQFLTENGCLTGFGKIIVDFFLPGFMIFHQWNVSFGMHMCLSLGLIDFTWHIFFIGEAFFRNKNYNYFRSSVCGSLFFVVGAAGLVHSPQRQPPTPVSFAAPPNTARLRRPPKPKGVPSALPFTFDLIVFLATHFFYLNSRTQ